MEVKIYTSMFCPFCENAKKWFNDREFEYEEVDLSNLNERLKFYERVGENIRTVPQIFIGDERIGGWTELVNQQSRVEEMLNKNKVGFNSCF